MSEGDGWQPIETAPLDGSPVLIPTGDDRFPIACVIYDSSPYYGVVYGWKDDEEVRYSPEWWAPVPSPPAP